jgi:hypothetical protein
LLASSIVLNSATKRSPSWCLPISVVVFPQVHLHEIFHPFTLPYPKSFFRRNPRLFLNVHNNPSFMKWVCPSPFVSWGWDQQGINSWDLGGVDSLFGFPKCIHILSP